MLVIPSAVEESGGESEARPVRSPVETQDFASLQAFDITDARNWVPWLRLRSHADLSEEGFAIDRDGCVFSRLPGPVTRPLPVVDARHQSTPDRIRMDVVDFLSDVIAGSQVPVVSAATLPEAILAASVRLAVLHTLEEGRALAKHTTIVSGTKHRPTEFQDMRPIPG